MGQQGPSWPNSAQSLAVGVALTTPAALRALWCTYPSSLCAENEEAGRKAGTEKAAWRVQEKGPAADSLPGRNAAGPNPRLKAAKPGPVRPAGHSKHDSSAISLDDAQDRVALMEAGELNHTELRQSWVRVLTPSTFTESNSALNRTHIAFEGLA